VKRVNKAWSVALALSVGAAQAASDAPPELAALTARNIAMLSSAISAHQAGMNDIATTRAAHIVSVSRLSVDARQATDRELDILKQTGGAEIVKMFQALCDHGDRAALVSSQGEAAEAAAKADIAAAYTPLAFATDQLDRAANTLAGLAKKQSTQDRARILLQFAKDVRDESARLSQASDAAKTGADEKLSLKVETAAASAAASSSSK
jgi:hypothetical protein